MIPRAAPIAFALNLPGTRGPSHPPRHNRTQLLHHLSFELIARIQWLLSKTLVAEGLPDVWRVRVDGDQLEELQTLDQISHLKPGATLQIRTAELEGTDARPPAWLAVRPDSRFLKGCNITLLCLALAGGACASAYVFKLNHGSAFGRLAWASALGLASAGLLRATGGNVLSSLVWFFHLFSEHRRAFLLGGALGALGGMLTGFLLWNFAVGIESGLIVSGLEGLAVGLLSAAAFAQRDHQFCARRFLTN